ncbi:MAG: polyprenyl diphosphate synthase [Nanoarchaeota archaeon]
MVGENSKIPEHVVIIPDGNRRWARKRGLSATRGHVKAGSYANLNPLFREAKGLGIKYLSFWGFSTENWKRDKKEVDIIMRVILKGLNEFDEDVENEKVRFVHVGRKDRMLGKLVDKIGDLEEKTKKYTDLVVVLCLDYGGRDEVVRAVNKILKEGKREIDEKGFADYLDTKGLPDPELIIRTGGEKRMSGFMPYQSTYAELYFTDVYFPDFDAGQLRKAVDWFMKVDRRFGGD